MRLLLSGFLLALGSATVAAETIDRTVKANSRTAVGSFFIYRENLCQAGAVPDARVRSQPAHGTVTIEVRQSTLGPTSRCPGTPVRGPVFIYTPEKGFRGTDQFEIDIPFARVEERMPTLQTHTYRIRVE